MANKYLDYTGLQHVINKVKALIKVTGVKGNAESAYRTGNVNLTAANVGAAAVSHTHSPDDITEGYMDKRIYYNTHPEANGGIIPFLYNDLAFLTKKGGSYSFYKTDASVFTAETLNETSAISTSLENAFDGSPSYANFHGTVAVDDVCVIDIALHKIFKYTNVFYIDFGSAGWRAKNITVLVKNANNETEFTQKGQVTNQTRGHWYLSVSHTSKNTSGTTVQGFNRIRIVISGFGTGGKRIAQIGLINYGSSGVTETFISRGGCNGIYGDLIPYGNSAQSLGSSSKKWKEIYGALKGNADTATNATKVNNHTVNSDVPANAVFKIKNTAHFYTVGTGCEYATINDALAVANADGGKSTILIMAGKYYEEISLLPANDITLIGLGNVSITGNGTYPEGCLNVVGKFQAHNIIFETLATSNGYAFHHEDMLYETSNCGQKFVNCTFYALGNSAVGLGIGNNTIEFINCTFYSGSSGNHAIYAHNSGSNTGKIGNLVVTNCTVQGSVRIDNLASLASTDNQLYVKMVGNSDIEGFTYYDYSQTLNYFPTGTTVQLSNASVGNNLNVLNRVRNEISADGSRETVNPVSDLNNFFTGIASFSAGTTNLPSNDWWLVMSGGINGTTIQVAYSLWNNQVPKTRYCAGGTWSAWANLKTS